MIANVYSHGKHTRLRVAPSDVEELIARCGWPVLDQLEEVSEQDRQAIAALEAQGYAESLCLPWHEALEWWRLRVVSEVPCLTPDM